MLAAVRIRTVCERVGQSQQLIERVYKVFQHALHHETNLFFNRHIDQLVLCTIYGVCKVGLLFNPVIVILWSIFSSFTLPCLTSFHFAVTQVGLLNAKLAFTLWRWLSHESNDLGNVAG